MHVLPSNSSFSIILIFVLPFLWYYCNKRVSYTSSFWRLRRQMTMDYWWDSGCQERTGNMPQYQFVHQKLHLDYTDFEFRLLWWQPDTIVGWLVDPLLRIISCAQKAPWREANIWSIVYTREVNWRLVPFPSNQGFMYCWLLNLLPQMIIYYFQANSGFLGGKSIDYYWFLIFQIPQ
jgi:hypothetical protein